MEGRGGGVGGKAEGEGRWEVEGEVGGKWHHFRTGPSRVQEKFHQMPTMWQMAPFQEKFPGWTPLMKATEDGICLELSTVAAIRAGR